MAAIGLKKSILIRFSYKLMIINYNNKGQNDGLIDSDVDMPIPGTKGVLD